MISRLYGGETGIRTLGPRKGSTVFETAPFDRSGTSPRRWSCRADLLEELRSCNPDFLSLPLRFRDRLRPVRRCRIWSLRPGDDQPTWRVRRLSPGAGPIRGG